MHLDNPDPRDFLVLAHQSELRALAAEDRLGRRARMRGATGIRRAVRRHIGLLLIAAGAALAREPAADVECAPGR